MQFNPTTRRTFFKNAAKAILLSVLFNPLRNLLAYGNNETIPSWTELVDHARWCPTVHNLQPHLIKIISETEAELYYNPPRLLPIGDPNSIFATLAMGIFQEHLSIAASPYGKKVEITEVFSPVNIENKEPTLFAKLRLISSTEKEELNRELIKKRRTSRLKYNGKPLNQETLAKIKNETAKFEHTFFSTSNQEVVDLLVKLNQETLFEDINSKANCEELDHLFRYTKKEAKTKKDGLWAKCMCFPGLLVKSVLQHPEKWHKGLREKLLTKYYKAAFKGTSTICWFEGKFDNTNDWLKAGRMFARTWLLITKENAYIQPFGSLITNIKAYKQINEELAHPAEGNKLWMIFRTGYSKEPTRSFRLSTEEIIIK